MYKISLSHGNIFISRLSYFNAFMHKIMREIN